MSDKVTIKPAGNKSRFGYRGEKRRYAVFKAEWNKKWAPHEERWVRQLCEEHGLEVEQFLDPEDNPNRQWTYAYVRLKRVLARMPALKTRPK